jgi:hypothetical protein
MVMQQGVKNSSIICRCDEKNSRLWLRMMDTNGFHEQKTSGWSVLVKMPVQQEKQIRFNAHIRKAASVLETDE